LIDFWRPPHLFVTPNLRVGLLGGSFNPAHEGHVHISEVALKRLGLDQIWWLVSPQNPLKSSRHMAPLQDRVAQAKKIVRNPHIKVTDIESKLGTQFTANTLTQLTRRYSSARFIWIMGADNLIQLPKWKNWNTIMNTVPVAVIDRPGSVIKAQLGHAATRYSATRLSDDDAPLLAFLRPPVWTVVHSRLNPVSATALRAKLGSTK